MNKSKSNKHNIGHIIAFCIVLLIAVVFIGIGISQGGIHDTMSKAIRICLECIGIG